MTDELPIVIRLAGAPVAKGRARSRLVKGKGAAPFIQTYSPEKTRKYEDKLRYAAQMVMGDRVPLEGALAITVTAALPIAPSWSKKKQAAARAGEIWPTSRPDADNYLKAAKDGLNQVVYRDDSQVVIVTVVKVYSERPELLIVVRAAEPRGSGNISIAAPPQGALL